MGKTKQKRRPSPEQEQTKGQFKGQVPQRGFKEAHVLAVVNKGQNKRERNVLPQNKNKPRRKCRSVVSKIQGGIRFVQWRIRRRRIIRTRFWKSLSRNIAFFCFPLFFLTDCWYIQRWSTSSDSWLAVIEPRGLVTFGEILPSIDYEIQRLSPSFVLLFIQGLLSVPERFMLTKWIGFESVTTLIECKQQNYIELKWGLCREKSLGSQWIMRIMTAWRFINFYLTRARFYILPNFFGNDTFNNETIDRCSPSKVWIKLNSAKPTANEWSRETRLLKFPHLIIKLSWSCLPISCQYIFAIWEFDRLKLSAN